MRIERGVGAATAVLLVAGLAGCSSDEGSAGKSPSPAGAVSSAAASSSSTEPSDTGTTAAEPAARDEGYDAEELIAAMQAAMKHHRSAHVTMRMTGGQMRMTAGGDVSYAGPSTAMRLVMQSPGLGMGRAEMRTVGGVLYMSMPPVTPDGKFVKVDPDDPNGPMAGLDLSRQLDPMRSFDTFREGLKRVRFMGEESVDGEDMDHYELTVDTAAMLKASGRAAPPGMPETMVYDLWLDRHDLMRRMSFDLGGTGMVLEMSQWGKPVHVTAPPASDIVQMPQVPQMPRM